MSDLVVQVVIGVVGVRVIVISVSGALAII